MRQSDWLRAKDSWFRVQVSSWVGQASPRRASKPHSKILATLLAGFIALGAFVASAQDFDVQPATAQVSDQPETETEQPLQPIPELPDTIVPGRLDDFPSAPLPDDVVVAPNREPTPLSQTGSSITVITEEEIVQSGKLSVAEVLRARVGADVVRSGSAGGITSLFLRGANSAQTKVLLDGIPLNDPTSASRAFDFSMLSTDNIERIEVLRGPQSMMYGSDAIGGVINIITKRGSGPLSIRGSGQGGSFQSGQTSLGISGGNDAGYYSVTGSFLSTGGISAASARVGGVEHDAFNLGTIQGRVGSNVSENWNLDYAFRYANGLAEIDDDDFFTNLPVDNLTRKNGFETFANRVQLSNWLVEGLVQHRVGFNLVDYRREDRGSNPVSTFDGQTRELDYFASAQLTETNIVSAGTNYLHEEANNVSTFNPFPPTIVDAQQHVQGVFVQDEFQLAGRFFGTAGARWDNTSGGGPAQTYRITGICRFDEFGTALHGTLGSGFRQASLAERFDPFVGNPNLSPERSVGWDLGVRHELCNGLWMDATYFRNDFEDLIIFSGLTLDNVARARSNGVELSAGWQINDLWLADASYTYDDTIDLSSPNPNFINRALLRRPWNKAAVGLSRYFPDHCAHARMYLNMVGERLDIGPRDAFFQSTVTALNPYMTLNFAGTWQATDFCELLVRLENLTNTEYEEVNGFGAPGFAAYGGVTMTY